jgi:hypothetical protein
MPWELDDRPKFVEQNRSRTELDIDRDLIIPPRDPSRGNKVASEEAILSYLVSRSNRVFPSPPYRRDPERGSPKIFEPLNAWDHSGMEHYREKFVRISHLTPAPKLMVGTSPVPYWSKMLIDDKKYDVELFVQDGDSIAIAAHGFCVCVAPSSGSRIMWNRTTWYYFHPFYDFVRGMRRYMMIEYEDIAEGSQVNDLARKYLNQCKDDQGSYLNRNRNQYIRVLQVGLRKFSTQAWWIGYAMARRMM